MVVASSCEFWILIVKEMECVKLLHSSHALDDFIYKTHAAQIVHNEQ
jgi:hypothetical protein